MTSPLCSKCSTPLPLGHPKSVVRAPARAAGIDGTPGVCGGDAVITRTRIPVWLLEKARREGLVEAEILAAYPGLRAEDLANARAYVEAHRAEIEEAMVANGDEEGPATMTSEIAALVQENARLREELRRVGASADRARAGVDRRFVTLGQDQAGAPIAWFRGAEDEPVEGLTDLDALATLVGVTVSYSPSRPPSQG